MSGAFLLTSNVLAGHDQANNETPFFQEPLGLNCQGGSKYQSETNGRAEPLREEELIVGV